jgi:hypothetical protein
MTPKQNACRTCGGFTTVPRREMHQAETKMVPCPDCTEGQSPVVPHPGEIDKDETRAMVPARQQGKTEAVERREWNAEEKAMLRRGNRHGAKIAYHKRMRDDAR